ncbi:MAG: hypothetical protein J4F34_02760 [Gemmatimonadetes bacterium]|nr:hypothetical protein [Gemmatimonadota bacterium]
MPSLGRAGGGSAACAALALLACDLALEARHLPTSLVLTPADTLVTVGDPAKLSLVVLDQDGNPMPGPPGWAPPRWTPSAPGIVAIQPGGEFEALKGGSVEVDVEVAGRRATARLRTNPRSVLLSSPAVYLNQVIQNRESDVPLIAGRQALLRVFVTADQLNYYLPPKVRVTLYHDGEVVLAEVLEVEHQVLSPEVVESSLTRSHNLLVPGRLVRPGLELLVELDPEDVVPKSPGSRTRVPAEGRMVLDIVEMPVLEQTFVPTLLTLHRDEGVFDWTDDISPESPQVQMARTMLPVGEMTVTVHETYESDADLTTSAGWSQYLREIEAIWNMEGRIGYYYGVVVLPEGSPSGGRGFVGRPVSVGRPRHDTYAHELGHNTSLRHAPCGGAAYPDPGYPYQDGQTGHWGYDFASGKLVDPSIHRDLMGYCLPDWVSDYHFVLSMRHRLEEESAPPPAGAKEPTLMLWGSASSEEVLLEPAFFADAVPSLPERPGRYRLQGLGPGGEVRFDLSFAPTPVDHGGAHFLFNVPYEAGRDGPLERVLLSGPAGRAELGPSGGRTMAIVRDRGTGDVLAIRRDWEGDHLPGDPTGPYVLVSGGIPGDAR